MARRILGNHVNAPTVAFLIPQAYQMRQVEWDVIRGILETDEKSRVDLQHLSQVLEFRMGQQSTVSQRQPLQSTNTNPQGLPSPANQ